MSDALSAIERAEKAGTQLRQLIREAHETLGDLRQALRQAESLTREWQQAEARIKALAGEQRQRMIDDFSEHCRITDELGRDLAMRLSAAVTESLAGLTNDQASKAGRRYDQTVKKGGDPLASLDELLRTRRSEN